MTSAVDEASKTTRGRSTVIEIKILANTKLQPETNQTKNSTLDPEIRHINRYKERKETAVKR